MSAGTIKPLETADVTKESSPRSTLSVGARIDGASKVRSVARSEEPRRAPGFDSRRERYRSFVPGARSLRRTVMTSIPLVVADLLSLVAAVAISASAVWLLGFSGPVDYARLVVSLECSLLVTFMVLGLYPGIGLNPVVELRQATCAVTLVFCVFLAAIGVHQVFGPHAAVLLSLAWPLAVAMVPVARATARAIGCRFSWWGQKVLIFGGGATGLAVHKHLQSRPSLGLRPVGIVDDEVASSPAREHGCYRGGLSHAAAIAEGQAVAWAVVAMPERSRLDILQVIKQFTARFPHLLVVPDIQGLPTLWTSAQEFGGLPALQMQERLMLPLPRVIKRVMDLLLIVVSTPLLLPLLGLVALLVKLDSAGPVFYSQERIGLGGRRFRAWKFRSMAVNADRVLKEYLARDPELRLEWERDHKLRRDPRVTRMGRLLRKTSLDELPQLWNVLRGEMSLVGPRPIVEAEISKYSDRFEQYVKVTPGITGLWQISGRNDTSYRERVELDAFYACNWSAWLDLYILARTVKVVLRRDGAY